MNAAEWIEMATGHEVLGSPALVQELWSGYGRIERWTLRDTAQPQTASRTIILKVVDPGARGPGHPRGWSSTLADNRKRKSYLVERAFYRQHLAGPEDRPKRSPRTAARIADRETTGGGMLILEDLDGSGFDARHSTGTDAEVRACLRWLAAFHAAFLGASTGGLWERGTYWHLDTRPDELAAIPDPRLRAAAHPIDARLGTAAFQTLVHGDAKIANFCFRGDVPRDARQDVAAVDFQYVGGGTGVQDLSYFLGSCLGEEALASQAERYLDAYFAELHGALDNDVDGAALEREWRTLWPYAWADFHRFLAGWAPGHWKLSRYSESMLRSVL